VLLTDMMQSWLGTLATPSSAWAPPELLHMMLLEFIESVAGLADVPKMPKTKVAIATAAIRVMAIRMTVARTGLIALRFDLNWILKVDCLPVYGRTRVNVS